MGVTQYPLTNAIGRLVRSCCLIAVLTASRAVADRSEVRNALLIARTSVAPRLAALVEDDLICASAWLLDSDMSTAANPALESRRMAQGCSRMVLMYVITRILSIEV
jgi:hypothetical protein